MDAVPEWLINTLPAVGIIGLLTAFCYLYIMYDQWKNAYCMFYGLAIVDVIFHSSVVYAGFHGITVVAAGNTGVFIRPIACLSQAIHLTLWNYCDAANILILTLLAVDQLVSIIWSKTHNELSAQYFRMPILILIFVISFGIIVPVWHHAVALADQTAVTINPACYLADVVYPWFYEYELEARKWAPMISLGGLFLTSCMLLLLQLHYKWEYKWSDDNQQSQQMFFFALLRCLLTLIAVHIPIIMESASSNPSSQFRKTKINKTEYFIRFSQCVAYGIVQPGVSVALLSKYYNALKACFDRYSHNTKRNWQSADDPPVNKHQQSSDPVFGSWYSSTGNVCGDAGVPVTFDASEQRSVSFYYNEMQVK